MGFWTWFEEVCLYGVRPILYTVVRLVHKGFNLKLHKNYREKELTKAENCFIYFVGYALKFMGP